MKVIRKLLGISLQPKILELRKSMIGLVVPRRNDLQVFVIFMTVPIKSSEVVFTLYPIVVIIFFNTDLNQSTFFSFSIEKILLCLSGFSA